MYPTQWLHFSVLKYIVLLEDLSFGKLFYDQFLMNILAFSYLLRFSGLIKNMN